MTEEAKKRYFVSVSIVHLEEFVVDALSEGEAARRVYERYDENPMVDDLFVQHIDPQGYPASKPRLYLTDDYAIRHEPRFHFVQRFTLSGLDEPPIMEP